MGVGRKLDGDALTKSDVAGYGADVDRAGSRAELASDAAVAAVHDVVEGTRIFDAQLASHAPRLPRPALPSSHEVVEVRN